jgi:hypothetical protein
MTPSLCSPVELSFPAILLTSHSDSRRSPGTVALLLPSPLPASNVFFACLALYRHLPASSSPRSKQEALNNSITNRCCIYARRKGALLDLLATPPPPGNDTPPSSAPVVLLRPNLARRLGRWSAQGSRIIHLWVTYFPSHLII